ncbi:MAG: M20/M25/M40 family metallo-hydrolase [Methylobacteriaceae bacterium]|jgi:glutamate carboxypeptidase|nr:M20/M25/M40 family metallo-hydrolase [Methylobacteriaceae bacterium]
MDLLQWKQQLDRWFNDRLPEMITLLQEMVNRDSSSHDGDSVNALGEWLMERMRGYGFDTVKLPKPAVPEDEPWRANLGNVFSAYSHQPGAGIILSGHIDTVFPTGTTSRWRFAVDGDTAIGPGVADMKGGVVLNIFAARALKELGLLSFPLTLTFSCDEELGSVSSMEALKAYVLNGWADLNTEPARDAASVIGRAKGSGHLRLRVEGKGAHSSMDYAAGASAIIEIAEKTLEINKLIDLDREIVVNTGLISGGTSAGTVAPFADSALHMSFPLTADGPALLQKIRDIVARPGVPGTTCTLSGNVRLPPLEDTAQNRELFGLVQAAGACVGLPLEAAYARWASEAGFFSSTLGLPAVCGLGPVGGGFHSEDEYLIVSSMIPRCMTLALAALQAARVFGPGES